MRDRGKGLGPAGDGFAQLLDERKKAEFATNVQLLKELRSLERPKRKR